MKSFLMICLFLFLFATPSVSTSVPRAADPEQCELFANYALTVRALTKNGVSDEKIRAVLSEMYSINSKNGQDIARMLVQKAKTDARSPNQFSIDFGVMCIENKGDVSKFFGKQV